MGKRKFPAVDAALETLVSGSDADRITELNAMGMRIAAESDRGAVLVVGSHAENLLEVLLRSVCREGATADALFSGATSAFGSFSARIRAAHALGLIPDDIYDSLEQLREARNYCAHHVLSVDFTDQKLRAHVQNIKVRPLHPSLITPQIQNNPAEKLRLAAFAGEFLGFVYFAVREAKPHQVYNVLD